MAKLNKKNTLGLPMIVRHVESTRHGIQSHVLSRYAIGYVLRGTKHIYYGDKYRTVSRGDLFFLNVGHHYTEEIPDAAHPFEQIIFYYTPDQMQEILLHLNMTYNIDIENRHSCDECRSRNYVVTPAWNAVRNFFIGTSNYIHDELFRHNEAAENIKMTELIYLIVSHGDCCIKNKVLSNVDVIRGNFEYVIYSNIFSDVSIEELASQCNRSLTSFKKEFKRRFDMPPHQWFIQQRMMRARLLLISTAKSISEVGSECAFPNTSHFIKLFKKEYNATPAIYRNRHQTEQMLRESVQGAISVQQEASAM